MTDRKIYPSIDIVKFIMAMLILTQHTSNEWAHSTGLVHAFFGLGNFAVPFFFACSGFLFFSKMNILDGISQKEYYIKWSTRIGKMYLVWSAIYLCFVFYSWVSRNILFERLPGLIHGAVVYSTYATIWFLPALWVGVSICYLMKRYCSMRIMWITMILLMIVGNLFGSYSNIMTQDTYVASFYKWYMSIFITWRNGIFNGAPYVFIGLLLAENKACKTTQRENTIATCIFSAAFLAEAFIISHYHLSTATDMGFMMAPAIFFMLNTLIKWDIKQRTIWQHFRNLSMLVFLSQRLFLTALPSVLPGMKEWILSLPEVSIYFYFISVVLTFSVLIERLSKRYKFLKVLW
ncbi:MAG: acyltransferase [Bacteroidaceae bacterium]|nr:acyltransferase [Bacteroidaceae bacterium]